MSARAASGLAWSAAGAATLALALATALRIVNGTDQLADDPTPAASWALIPVMLLAYSFIGALIASKFPRNPIGWLLCASGLVLAVTVATEQYAAYALVAEPGSLPAGKAVLWAGHSIAPMGAFPVITFFLLLFPDGRLPSRRWRPVAWLAGAALVAVLLGAFAPGPLLTYEEIENPFAAGGAAGDVVAAVQGLGWLLTLTAVAASAGSLIVRFRKASGQERLQIKWVAFAAAFAAFSFLLTYVVLEEVWADADAVLGGIWLLVIPVAAAIAIFKHRLYDIDVVINRTLVYGALTATLAVTYLGSVLLLQLALSGVTEGSSFAVAASTLGVAALFRPARGRIQEAVDRRFFRRKYDAARTIERFGAHVRDEVDLDALGGELRAVVAETMQPAYVSLWLRGSEAAS